MRNLGSLSVAKHFTFSVDVWYGKFQTCANFSYKEVLPAMPGPKAIFWPGFPGSNDPNADFVAI